MFLQFLSFIFKKFTWLLNSFSIKDNGASRRALSAFFAIVVMGSFITYKHTNDSNASTMLAIWLTFGALCLGMITAEQIVKLKNGDSNTEQK